MESRSGMSTVGNQGYISSSNSVGGSIPGVLPNSAAIGNRTTIPGGGGNIGRNISSGGLSAPGNTSRLNLAANSGAGNLNVEGQNRLMAGMLQQASPQVLSMFGNSYPNAGWLPFISKSCSICT